MIKEFIGTGKTVEEATSAAKVGLGAPDSADVKVEIVEMPKKGFLGIGSKPAQVKVSYDDGVKESAPKKKPSKQKAEVKKQQPQQKPAKKAPEKKEAQKPSKQEVREPKRDRDYPESVDLEYAKSYFGEIVKGLEITDAKIDAEYSEGVITLTLECDDYGIVIGRRGETLDSIQYLLSLAMKKSSNGYVRVAINVGNYREKRTETLKHLAAKNAAYVLKTGRRHTFEPMNPYERRIIHTAIQEIDGVESRSVGYNQDRRVVLEPTGGVRPRSNGGYRRGSRSAQRATAPDPNRVPKADRTDVPKFGKIEVNKD